LIYFRSKLRELTNECRGKERAALLATAPRCCPMCDREKGDPFMFGPTRYLKRRIKFSVSMDVHVVEGSTFANNKVVICNGCHISYHWLNRLQESAELGGKKLADTVYKRCRKCGELNCMCCKKCNKAPRKCICGGKKAVITSKNFDGGRVPKRKSVARRRGSKSRMGCRSANRRRVGGNARSRKRNTQWRRRA
jgi:hypothetical protein